MRTQICLSALSGLLISAHAAMAQPQNLPLQGMNFDLWCQEQAGRPAAECDKRTREDEAAFEAYRTKIDRYETPYVQQKLARAQMDHDMLNNDPVDNPITHDQAAETIKTPAAMNDDLPAR
jgi:protein involved in sex pheromone biosynthesis